MTSTPEESLKKFKDALYNAASEAIDRGWNVFPLSISSKKPLIDWQKYQDRYVTQEEVDEWFTTGVESKSGDLVHVFNLAVVTGAISNLVVLDCDNETAEAYAKSKGWRTPFSVKTTRGSHYYYSHPGAGFRVMNKVGGIGRDWPDVGGLDLRGDGGYVLLPPSVKLNEGKVVHTYEWQIQESFSIEDIQDFPWHYNLEQSDSEFNFATLDLSSLSVMGPDKSLSVIDQIKEKIALLGRCLTDGDGRNAWLIKYAGHLVRRGVVGDDLRDKCLEFQDEYFLEPLDTNEFNRTLQSAVEMDRRNYPDDWEGDTFIGGDEAEEQRSQDEKAPSPIYLSNVDDIMATLKETRYILEPFIAPGEITQVVGFNGHGKSLFLEAMLIGAAANVRQVGPFRSSHAPRVLYLDYDNPKRTVLSRFKNLAGMFGDTEKNFAVWSPAIMRDDRDMQLNTPEGRARLGVWIRHINPEVVVIDTTRNAFPGMDENSPKDWVMVNMVLKAIRDIGAAVVIVHHRNKPQEGGLGREAGSTAQLTDLDTQVYVTRLDEDKLEAKMNASLFDEDLVVKDINDEPMTPMAYLRAQCGPNEVIKTAQQIRYGKLRDRTALHVVHYIGYTTNIMTGEQGIVSTLSPKQRVKHFMSMGLGIDKIAAKLFIEQGEIEAWINSAITVGQNTGP